MKCIYTAFALVMFTCIQAIAQQTLDLPAGLRDKIDAVVFSSDRSGSASVFNDSRKDVIPSTCKNRDGEKGNPVYEVQVFQNAANQYGVTLHWNTTAPIRKGDVILARMSMRTIEAAQESGECEVHFYLQTAGPEYAKAFIIPLGTDASWKTFDIPVIANRDYPAGTSIVELGFGSLKQHVEVTGVEILNFGRNVSLEDLPETSYSYKGREKSAAWRQEALERIEKLRTAIVDVIVLDNDNNAVKGAEVNVKMTKSDFIWGSAANEMLCSGKGDDSEEYRRHFLELFNTATLENGLKTKGWDWESGRKSQTIQAFEWLYKNGVDIRGHNLVWPGWKFNSGYVRDLAETGNKEMFDSYIKARFYERMAYTKGRVIAWDVINEMMHEDDLLPYLPENAPSEWFKLAEKLDPDAKLFINDYNMLTGVQSVQNCRKYIEMISSLLDEGAPVDGIGIQGHIGRQPRSPELILSDLDMFLPLGLPIQITEFDIETKDEELQADYTRDFLIAVYSHPLVSGVILWGFWEGMHWKEDAAMFRKDWSEKPNAEVWKDLVLGEWKTDRREMTGKTGEVSVRGHFGEYEISVTYKGETRTRQIHLGPEGEEIIMKIE